jgi:LPXTG-site transpeptidase (sortase) family protein
MAVLPRGRAQAPRQEPDRMLSSLTTRNAWRRLPAAIIPVLALGLIAACGSGHRTPTAASTPPIVNAPATTVATPAPSATPSSGPVDDSPLAEFRMHGAADSNGKQFDVTGKIVPLSVDPATNTMESPNNKDDVGFYDFSAHPGTPCQSSDQCANTVLSGHVDWYTGQTGVFWDLRFLKDGDEVDLKLQDGTVYKYKVVANTVYSDEDAPVQQIIGPTPQPSVTLITCDGVFNPQLQEYNKRRVVRAVQMAG